MSREVHKNTHFTIMIIPHSDKSSFSVRMPIYIFQGIAVVLVIALIFGINFAGSYLSLREEVAEVEELRAIKREQREKIDQFAKETEKLNQKVNQLSETADKVREILDMEDVERLEEVEAKEAYKDKLADQVEREDKDYTGGYKTPFHSGTVLGTSSNPGQNEPYSSASCTADRAGSNLRHLFAELPAKQVDLDELKEAAVEKEEERKHTPKKWPAKGEVTSGFGHRRNPLTRAQEFHEGIDISGDRGDPVVAPANGQVVYRDYRGGYGNLLIIDHGYGYRTHYAHLSEFKVEEGAQIKRGDLIAKIGTTGFSTGPHLHYEIHMNGEPVDPMRFLDESS